HHNVGETKPAALRAPKLPRADAHPLTAFDEISLLTPTPVFSMPTAAPSEEPHTNPYSSHNVVAVAKHLLKKRPPHNPWSLCELKFSEAECQVHWNWLNRYGPSWARYWMNRRVPIQGISERMAFGLVLMFAE